jgi:hypothetical protein
MGDSNDTSKVSKDVADMSAATIPKMSVVTPQRKEELLLLARNERRQWIERVPLPYDSHVFEERKKVRDGDLWTLPISSSSGSSSGGGGSSSNSRCRAKIKSSFVSQKIPSCLVAISELYGVPALSSTELQTSSTCELSSKPLNTVQVAERIDSLVSFL